MGDVQKLKVGLWNLSDQGKRIFLAGASEDEPTVKLITKALRVRGYEVFFYKFCVGPNGALCADEIVGSYFKSAGQAFVVDTFAAAQSPFVTSEVQLALAIGRGRKFILMLTPDEVAVAVRMGRQQGVSVALTLENDSK